MKIVVLDGHAANPGDLDWGPLEALGECTFYDRTPAAETAARMAGAEIAITNKVVFGRSLIEALGNLRYIGVTATGYNIVDIDAAREHGIVVTNVPDYSSKSVAQAVFALLLELTNRVGHHARTVREGRWAACPDFTYWDHPLVELDGLTMGIVGFGTIGSAVARIASSFGMRVIASTRTPKKTHGVEFVDIDSLFSRSDVISLHCPLTPETERLVSPGRIALMKPTAYLINTSRGPVVDEEALACAPVSYTHLTLPTKRIV